MTKKLLVKIIIILMSYSSAIYGTDVVLEHGARHGIRAFEKNFEAKTS